MTVKKLLHTRMRVNDIERTVKFYEQALGLTVARRHIVAARRSTGVFWPCRIVKRKSNFAS